MEKRDVKVLCQLLFKADVTEMQQEIIRVIAFNEHKRVVISAFTRYGKTFAVALGVCLYILFNESKRILLIAPTYDQSTILRNYVAEFLLAHPVLSNLIDADLWGLERLKKEVSKRRITFKNKVELTILSAEGEGERLMGFGGDLIVIDESCLIGYGVYRQKISRMLGDNADSTLVEIGNPWHKSSHFYEHWTSQEFKKVHIDWKIGIAEGRIQKEFLEQQREALTTPEFDVLYNATFPEESEDTLIGWKLIEAAVNRPLVLNEDNVRVFMGVDVARFGTDLTVLTMVKTDSTNYQVLKVKCFGKMPTTYTAGEILSLDSQFKCDKIVIDDVGIGGAVTDMLKKNDLVSSKAQAFNSGSTEGFSEEDKKRFRNWKAKGYDHLRRLFERGNISILNEGKLVNELSKLRKDFTSNQKLEILDDRPDVKNPKSPDFADSLCYACSETLRRRGGGFVFLSDPENVLGLS